MKVRFACLVATIFLSLPWAANAQKRLDHTDSAAIIAAQGRVSRYAGELLVRKLDGSTEIFEDEDECNPDGLTETMRPPCFGYELQRYDHKCQAFIIKRLGYEDVGYLYLNEKFGSSFSIFGDINFSSDCRRAVIAQRMDCCGTSGIQILRREQDSLVSEFLYLPVGQSEYADYTFASWEKADEVILSFSMMINGVWVDNLPARVVLERSDPPKWRLFSPLPAHQ